MVANIYEKRMSNRLAKASVQDQATVRQGQLCVMDSKLQTEVFVFGSQDTMNSVVVDVPTSTDVDDHTEALQPPLPPAQTGALPPLSLQPVPAPVTVVITNPTPPVSGSSTTSSSETPTLNGAIPGSDLTPTPTTSSSSPGLTPGVLPVPPTPPPSKPHTLSPPGRRVPRGQRHKTITGVTEDARKVLDQFLKRSLSHNDASPTQPHFPDLSPGDMDMIREHDPHDDTDGDARFQAISLEPGVDDDGTSHSPVSGPNSLYSCSSRSSSYRNRIHLVKPLPDDRQQQLRKAGQSGQKQKKSKSHRLVRRKSSSSSSSSEYEIVDGQLKLRRKKSLLKRLRASFRRKKAASRQSDFDPYNIDDDEIRDAQADNQPRTSKGLRTSLSRRQGADKSQWHSDVERRSPSRGGGESTVPDGPASRPPPGHRYTENGAVVVQVQGDDPELPRQGGKSAWRWVKEHLGRQKHSSETEKLKAHRGIFDRLVGQIRKGKDKLRRKSSRKDRTVPQRASSTDAITHYSTTHPQDVYNSHTTENGLRSRHSHRDGGRTSHNTRDSHWSEQRTPTAAATHWRTPGGVAGVGALYIDGPDSPPSCPAPPPPMFPQPEGSPRHQPPPPPPELRGLPRCMPSSPGGASCWEVDVESHVVTVCDHDGTSWRRQVSQRELEVILLQTSALDETDGVSPLLRRAVVGHPDPADLNKPFAQKTDQEKEEIYEKIAEQLATIADNYNLESPRSLKSAGMFFGVSPELPVVRKSQSAPGVTAPPASAQAPASGRPTLTVPVPSLDEAGSRGSGDHTPIEQKLGKILRDKGDKAASDLTDLGPVVKELVKNASYSKFQQVIHENVGSEPGWQQVALVFNLTRSAVQLAGLGTAAALQIKELTLRYFEDRFAGWIVGQGGWESVVEDTDLSSEVD